MNSKAHCKLYQQFARGDMPEKAFRAHAQTCSICAAACAQDDRLLQMSAALFRDIRAPLLWPKIESDLRAEQQRRERPAAGAAPFRHRAHLFLRVAAVLLLIVTGSLYFLLRFPDLSKTKILRASALEKVVQKQVEYEQAIAALEKSSRPAMAGMDIELALLYRDRLETIDAQIARCKEALAANPANAHIHRYLLAALVDKQETLRDLHALAQ